MAGPTPTIEAFYSGVWNDITPLDYQREELSITRGRADETTTVQPGRCILTLDNRDGRFSPRNPTGALFGLIGRNTPLRANAIAAQSWLDTPPGSTNRITTPDSASLSITGDLDLRAEVTLSDWRDNFVFIAKWGAAGQRSWELLLVFGALWLIRSTDGTASTTAISTQLVPWPAGNHGAVRATLDVNNGAGGSTIVFYTAPSLTGSWTQLGSPVITAGTTASFDSTAAVAINCESTFGYYSQPEGRFYAAEVRSGIAGSVVASPDMRPVAAGAASFTDAQGNVWTPGVTTAITRKDVRFSGEVPAWPSRWDPTGRDVYVPIEASGILRRLGQGASPLQSTMKSGLTTLTIPARAYWPCEDGERAEVFASALAGQPSIHWGSVDPTRASFTDFQCSAPLPVVGSSAWTGIVKKYTATNTVQTRFLLFTPTGGMPNNTVILRIFTLGTLNQWDLIYTTGGLLTLKGYREDGTLVVDSGAVLLFGGVNGNLSRISVELAQSGADVNWEFARAAIGDSQGGFLSGTETADTITRATKVKINPGSAAMTDVAIGHISVEDNITGLFSLLNQQNAYVAEPAGRRIKRLCSENTIGFKPFGDPDDTTLMGPQRVDTLLNLIRECEAADAGILFEPRNVLGLAYRPRLALYTQPARLTLDYHGDLSAIEPTDDDQLVRNDVTVTRRDGASDRRTLDVGALSTLAPPSGVGRYDEELTLVLDADFHLDDAASWRLHLGTVDEQRFPRIDVNLARSAFTSNAAKSAAVAELNVGDRLLVTSPPSWMPQQDIEQVAQGFTEVITTFEQRIALNCSPARPYDIAVFDDPGSRYSSDGTTTAEPLDTTETGVDVTTPVGPVWSVSDGSFDINIGGERMTVTAISGAGSAQTFTVTRSVNGVVKTHLTGVAVDLYRPVYWGL